MKKLAFLLSILFILALFAGCEGSTTTTPTDSQPSETGTSAPTETAQTPEPTEDASPYNLAAGKYEVNDRGFPLANYEYELPLSTTDEVFTFWTTCYSPEAITEDNFGDMPYQSALREKTGVNIEYMIISSDMMRENLSMIIASDDLPDLMSNVYYYFAGPITSGIEDGYFANLYDYKEYIPNYLYQVTRYESDPDVFDLLFYNDTTILSFTLGTEEPMPATGYCARADWLRDLGLTPEAIVTYDDIHEMLTRFKIDIGSQGPMGIFSMVEISSGTFACGYNTAATLNQAGLPLPRVVDGVPQFTLTQEDDRYLMQLLTDWHAEGLIDPNWNSYALTVDMNAALTTNVIGYMSFNPSELKDLEINTSDPDCEWVALTRPLMQEGQQLHFLQYGENSSMAVGGGIGGCVISARCQNIPLLATWCDYGYSVEGSLFISWGVEGITWEYDENGNRLLTDFALNNPDGISTPWLLLVYAMNPFTDPGIQHHLRTYAYPGGEKLVNFMRDTWIIKGYDKAYDWPRSLKFSAEQTTEINSHAADIGTYMAENWLAFVDGSKPMSEWDSYVQGLKEFGLSRCEEIYTEAYNTFLEKVESRG
ncbi:MAG: hypothetical protein GX111_04015 [Clostridiales bacterium]|jgi:putative aldouronate transport system substrate-binding protein|nr:hypothetical protein [Clostridiales bacterium]